MRPPPKETSGPDKGARSGSLIGSLVSDAQHLVALEIALARQELNELVTANAIAAGIIALGGLLAGLGLLVALPSLVVVLVPWHWQAAALWAAAYLLVGLALVLLGKSRLRIGLPRRTLESLKENKEWALRRVSSNGK